MDGAQLVFGSVCSGIEAASLAWLPLGWRCAFLSEIEAFPRAVLAHHYPDVTVRGDFRHIQAGDHDAIDVLVGGTPCQSFSVAGLRGGLDDARGNLAAEFVRLVERLRPRWCVWENVPGVRSSDAGRALGSVLGALAECGYGWAFRSLDAQYFGVPQRRERVFVVGHSRDWRGAAAVLFEPESLRGDPAPRRETGQSPAGALAASPGGSDDNDARDGRLIAYGGNNTAGPIDLATAVNACHTASGRQDFETETFIAHALRAEGFDASEDGTGRGAPLIPAAYRISPNCGAWDTGDKVDTLTTGRDPSGHVLAFDETQVASRANRSNPRPGDPCHPLAAGARAPAIAFDSKRSGYGGELAPTLRAMAHDGSHQNAGGQLAVAQRMGVRRLTPRECERLMGVPDDYTLVPYRGGLAKDGPRYRALGNSFAVPVVRWIGTRIALATRAGW